MSTLVKLEQAQIKKLRNAIKREGQKPVAEAIGLSPKIVRDIQRGGVKKAILAATAEKVLAYLAGAAATDRPGKPGPKPGSGSGSIMLRAPQLKALARAVEKQGRPAVAKAIATSTTNLLRILAGKTGSRETTVENIEAFLEGRPAPNPKEKRSAAAAFVKTRKGSNGALPLDTLLSAPATIFGFLKRFPAEEQLRTLRFCLETLERTATAHEA